MFDTLPKTHDEAKTWDWPRFEPYFADLEARDLTPESVDQWLRDMTAATTVIGEIMARARVATTQNTQDAEAEARLKSLTKDLMQPMQVVVTRLNRKLLESGLTPDNFEMPLKRARAAVEVFREENLPLQIEDQQAGLEYAKITGAQSVEWDGDEVTLVELMKSFKNPDRTVRKAAFDLFADRWVQDRQAINAIWSKAFDIRKQMAKNAGFDTFRDLVWKLRGRFDYAPDDNATFHRAIEEVVVPAAIRARDRRRQRLGLDTMKPYDVDVDASGKPPLTPWVSIDGFAETSGRVFDAVDPQLGAQYRDMLAAGLTDLPNRKHKGPGAYCATFPLTAKPFVFMNAVNSDGDVRTLIHEVGHAFHSYATRALPYEGQRAYPTEFAEVASFGMEMLSSPYLTTANGGYFTESEAARFRIDHLESIIEFWPYMAMVDAFQLWAYDPANDGGNPDACDTAWLDLKARFEPDIDYTGYDDYKATGWHRKQHIFRYPFYYIEYGLARLGAVQLYANAQKDQAAAVTAYRHALGLGGTGNLHQLFGAAGLRFAFDSDMLRGLIDVLEGTIGELETAL
ncbi:MAG: M3 family oligoendopeptidase [Chloroflexi bacterium]|nr:M3 family oligoendopeptidase [Chloroflexota bacterium]